MYNETINWEQDKNMECKVDTINTTPRSTTGEFEAILGVEWYSLVHDNDKKHTMNVIKCSKYKAT